MKRVGRKSLYCAVLRSSTNRLDCGQVGAMRFAYRALRACATGMAPPQSGSKYPKRCMIGRGRGRYPRSAALSAREQRAERDRDRRHRLRPGRQQGRDGDGLCRRRRGRGQQDFPRSSPGRARIEGGRDAGAPGAFLAKQSQRTRRGSGGSLWQIKATAEARL
jgi:hypothetical protein